MPKRPVAQFKDVRVDVKVRNNLILLRMEHRSINSVNALARQLGLEPPHRELNNLVNMTKAARNSKGKWHGLVFKLADFFECEPEELFSEKQQEIALEKNRSSAEIAYTEIQALMAQEASLTPELSCQASELRTALHNAMQALTPQEDLVIRLRFGFDGNRDLTLEEVGKIMGVTKEGVRKVEAHALKKLQHPSRSRKLISLAFGPTRSYKNSLTGKTHEYSGLDTDVLRAL